MKTISISVDVEPDVYTRKYKGASSLKLLTEILNKRKIKATFFVTSDCIKKYPSLFKTLKKQGHEIACHGFKHVRFSELSNKEKEEQIKKSLQCFKKFLNIKPKGFRAPQHSIDKETLVLLGKYYFKYDSSYSPWNFYHMLFSRKMINFKDNFTSRQIRKIKDTNNLYEIPIGTFILPLSALTLRILPKLLLKPFFFFISTMKNPVFMMHSWDLIEISKSKVYRKCPLPEFLKRLEMFIDFFQKNKFKKLEQLI